MSADRRRVALIGPVLPFRGGIAQHTTMLHRALSEIADGATWSFSRQYPAVWFPGKNDKDPECDHHREPGVDYCIDSINPLTWRGTVRHIVEFGADLVVLPWWHVYWAFCFTYFAHALRARGITVVYLCHNVVEHETSAWRSRLTRWALRRADRYVVHTREDEKSLRALIPGACVDVHPHPVYEQFPAPSESWSKRGTLELLFFGFVRPYKGLDLLIEAMSMATGDVYLTVAGEFWAGEEDTRRRIAELGLASRIELRPRYHCEADTAELFSRCDAVVLPYRSATGSGVVSLAYHYRKPVIATAVGGLPDMVHDGRTGWLVEPGSARALADMINGLTRQSASACVPAIREFTSGMTWGSLASRLIR